MDHKDERVATRTTTGTLSADVKNNPPNIPATHFVGDPDGMIMFRDRGYLTVSAIQKLGSLPSEFNSFWFYVPDSLPSDGKQHSYRFATGPHEAHGTYWQYEHNNVPYTLISGEITVSLNKEDHLVGSFECVGQFGTNRTVTVTRGKIDVKGFITPNTVTGTGFFNGTFEGGPLPDPHFRAQTVSLSLQPGFGPVPDFWQVQGLQTDSFPPVNNFLTIQIDKDLKGSSFDLKDNPKVRVSFARIDNYGFARAIDGKLNFTSLPSTGHAAGTVHCQLQRDREPAFSLDAQFDISEHIRGPK